MEENKNLVPQQEQTAVINYFGSSANFKDGWNIAGVLAKSDLVPSTFRGKPENCIIALNMAQRMNSDLLMVMQNLVVVHGNPTFEAKFAIACFNATGKYTAIKYKEEGEKGKDTWGFRAYAIEKSTGDVVEGPLVTIGTAKSEGWYNQNPKWKNVPELMLRYRAASWFIRTTDPGVMMGFQTREEVEDYTDFEELPPAVGDAAAEEEAQQQANLQVVDMDNDNNAPAEEAKPKQENKPADNAQKQEAELKEAKVKPMGAAPTPDIFKEQ